MRYFAYKETGEFNGFYTKEIHSDIPEKNVKITDGLWEELLSGSYRYKLNLIENIVLGIEDKDTYFEKVDGDLYVIMENKI